jgi:hypothetical protein
MKALTVIGMLIGLSHGLAFADVNPGADLSRSITESPRPRAAGLTAES